RLTYCTGLEAVVDQNSEVAGAYRFQFTIGPPESGFASLPEIEQTHDFTGASFGHRLLKGSLGDWLKFTFIVLLSILSPEGQRRRRGIVDHPALVTTLGAYGQKRQRRYITLAKQKGAAATTDISTGKQRIGCRYHGF